MDTPRHIAIIMDGNGRWAIDRGLRRNRGHRQGVETVRTITRECSKIGIKWLTLYAFSAENWQRPKIEVSFLMRLLQKFLVAEREEMMTNNIRFRVVGRISELPAGVRKEIERSIEMTADHDGLTLCLALNYGGRQEIVDAVRKLSAQIIAGEIAPSAISTETLTSHLYDPEMPDPDLVIRTSGEVRVSNFLLWQISYSEFYSTPVLWPDFGPENLHEAIREYARRERRFGGVTVGAKPKKKKS